MTALRSLFAVTALKNFEMMTFDIKTTILYGELRDNIYMYLPEGYKCENKIFKLKKALYELKQAPLLWNIQFSEFLKQKGFRPLRSE